MESVDSNDPIPFNFDTARDRVLYYVSGSGERVARRNEARSGSFVGAPLTNPYLLGCQPHIRYPFLAFTIPVNKHYGTRRYSSRADDEVSPFAATLDPIGIEAPWYCLGNLAFGRAGGGISASGRAFTIPQYRLDPSEGPGQVVRAGNDNAEEPADLDASMQISYRRKKAQPLFPQSFPPTKHSSCC